MEESTKEGLPVIPDAILDAIAGGSMNEDEQKWLLDSAAERKKKGCTKAQAIEIYYNTAFCARRRDISREEISALFDAHWDDL